MAIDGTIIQAERTAEGALVRLGPRKAAPYLTQGGEICEPAPSPTGVAALRIVGATWVPHVGDHVWGGSEDVTIESGGVSFPYRRRGYSRLVEGWGPNQSK